MQNKKKISVITGIYRPNEALFRKFLHSCLNQTLEGIQFVFIFDDPTDKKSRDIVNEYKSEIESNKNTFTILENENNLGIYATQMRGVQNALGEYIVFFDNDDFFDHEYLEVMYKHAKEFDANVIKGFALTHYFDDIDLNFTFICKHEHIFNEDDWLYMYKKEFFARYFNYSNMYTSDTSISRLIKDKWVEKEVVLQIPFYEGVFYHYVRHCDNTSFIPSDEQEVNKNGKDDAADQERIYERFMKDVKDTFGLENMPSKDELIEILQDYLGLDKSSNNYDFDRLKGL